MALPNQQAVDHPNYTIAIMGGKETGKTTYVENTYLKWKRPVDADDNLKIHDRKTTSLKRKRHVDDSTAYYQMEFTSNREPILFNCLDITDDLPDCYYMGFHGFIVMFDVTNRSTFYEIPKWVHKIRRVRPDIPIVLCANKVDLQNRHRHVNARRLAGWLNRYPKTKYCEISALSNYNLEKPFLLLAWMVVSKGWEISFMKKPDLVAPEFDLEAQKRNERELFDAVYRAQREAFLKKLFMPIVVGILNRDRNQPPDAPLPEDDDKLMSKMNWMLKVMMRKSIQSWGS